MSTVAIVPARKGSKGIPGKNMRPLLGKPLVQWTIEAALACPAIDDVLVSSDWDEVRQLADCLGAYGLERPWALATDTASTESVLDHILANLDLEMSTIVLLQPTSPNRTAEDITAALKLYRAGGYDSLFSAVRFDRFLWWQRGPEGDHHIGPLNYTLLYKRPRRQDIEYPQWLENGSIYVFDTKKYLETSPRNRLFGRVGVYPMSYWSQFELDTEEDWRLMEWVMAPRGGVVSKEVAAELKERRCPPPPPAPETDPGVVIQEGVWPSR